MSTKTIPLSEAKARLSEIMREVNEEGARYIVVKNNKPIGKITPIEDKVKPGLKGSLINYAVIEFQPTSREVPDDADC